LRAKAGATRRLWTACHTSLQLKLELEPFLGLVALVRSRAYAKRPVFTMVPVIEMANHAAQPNCELRFDEAGGQFSLVAVEPVAEHAELTVAYGPLSNADLLDAYGFTTPGNPRARPASLLFTCVCTPGDGVGSRLITHLIPAQTTASPSPWQIQTAIYSSRILRWHRRRSNTIGGEI
jgi:hypothetical protein